MLKNAPTLAIVAVHTEENEPPEGLEAKNFIISFVSLLVTVAAGRLRRRDRRGARGTDLKMRADRDSHQLRRSEKP